MKKPTRRNTINLRIRTIDGVETLSGIVGINAYPLAIHRPITEFQQIQEGKRSRYGSGWRVSHIPTGTSFGIISNDWNAVSAFVEEIKEEPPLLMLTLDTMQSHPDYDALVVTHQEIKKKHFRY